MSSTTTGATGATALGRPALNTADVRGSGANDADGAGASRGSSGGASPPSRSMSRTRAFLGMTATPLLASTHDFLIERHSHSTRSENSEVSDGPLGLVLTRDQHTISRLHTRLRKTQRHRIGPPAKISIADPTEAIFMRTQQSWRQIVSICHLIDERQKMIMTSERLELLLELGLDLRTHILGDPRTLDVEHIVTPVHSVRAPSQQLLVVLVQPEPAIYWKVQNKVPGLKFEVEQVRMDLLCMPPHTPWGPPASHPMPYDDTWQVRMDLLYAKSYLLEQMPEAYERLLLEALVNDHSHFVSEEELKAQWRIFTPVLQQLVAQKVEPEKYAYGSRGPPSADGLARRYGMTKFGGGLTPYVFVGDLLSGMVDEFGAEEGGGPEEYVEASILPK